MAIAELVVPGQPAIHAKQNVFRILMVISEAPPIISGISRVAAQLQQGIRSFGHDVDVISLNDVPRLAVGEVRLSSMIFKAPQVLLSRLSTYDLIHIHGPVPTFSDIALLLSAVGGKARGPAVVYTHHSEIDLGGYRVLCDIYNWMHKQLARLAGQVIVTTPAYARNLNRYIPAEAITVVPWGVEHDWYSARTPKADQFTVLFVGQLRPYKGIETLLDAAERVADTRIQIIGSGHQQEHYRRLATERGLEHVTFRGHVSDQELFDAFAQAHVLVLPSTKRAEAFGLVLLEGMVAGCVPVVSQLPGVTDVVGNAGFSFPVGDAAALAALLAQLRDSRLLRERYGARARERAREYSWDRTVFWHNALYQRLMMLRRFGDVLQTDRQSDTALNMLLHDTVSTLDASSGSIMMVDFKDDVLRLRATRGLSRAGGLTRSQPVGQGIAGFVASQNVPLLLPEAFSNLENTNLARWDQRKEIDSSLSVPIRAHDHTLGVLNLSSFTGGRRFSQDDLHWLDTLARRAARLMLKQQ